MDPTPPSEAESELIACYRQLWTSPDFWKPKREPRWEPLVGKRFVRRYRDDLAFEREVVFDDDLGYAELIVGGIMPVGTLAGGLTEKDLASIERGEEAVYERP